MNVYDFDDTIFKGDSTRDFFLFCLARYPRLLLYTPRQALAFVQYGAGRITKKRLKELFFGFLPRLPSVDAAVHAYWRHRQTRIKAWYLAQRQSTDVVISASPEFLLRPICQSLGVAAVIATRVNPATGCIDGENCRCEEKVARFLAHFPTASVEAFYSDHPSDAPMARLASAAFLVTGSTLAPWPDEK